MEKSSFRLNRFASRLRRRTSRIGVAMPRLGGLWRYLAILGPGIIAANAGNDAGGIATYASVGAEYGYTMLWAFIPLTVGLCVVQEMCARMGVVTGKGLSDLIREQFGVRWTALVMLALLVANCGVTISEFVGIGMALELFGIPRFISVPLAAAAIWWLIVKGSYKHVERVFLLMATVFFGYIASAFLAKPEWTEVFSHAVRPTFSADSAYLFTIIAVIGTTISPYMQVFVQSSVVEKKTRIEDYALTRMDVIAGTLFAMAIAFFISVSTAATLHAQNIKIESATDAAQALAPLAGKYAGFLFSIGLFGASMLAAGVLPLATAYSVTEALGFEKGLSRSFREAPIFLGIFTALIVVGSLVAILPNFNPISILLITQVINGLLLPILLFAAIRLANSREIMGEHANGRFFNITAWLVVTSVSILSLTFIGITVYKALFA